MYQIATSFPDPAKPGFYISGPTWSSPFLPEIGEEILDGGEYVRRVVKRVYRTLPEPEVGYRVMLVLSDKYPLKGWPLGPG